MGQTTISFRADDRTTEELQKLAHGRGYSETIRELIHAQYVAHLYAQAAADAERVRNDPVDLAAIKAANEDLDEISAW